MTRQMVAQFPFFPWLTGGHAHALKQFPFLSNEVHNEDLEM